MMGEGKKGLLDNTPGENIGRESTPRVWGICTRACVRFEGCHGSMILLMGWAVSWSEISLNVSVNSISQ